MDVCSCTNAVTGYNVLARYACTDNVQRVRRWEQKIVLASEMSDGNDDEIPHRVRVGQPKDWPN